MRTLSIMFILSTLIACGGNQLTISSPYDKSSAGRILVLKETLTIPPSKARVSIQYGKLVREADVDQYYAHCWFVSWKVVEKPQIIRPDTFDIIEIIKNEDIAQIQTPLRLASTVLSSSFFMQGSTAAVEYSTEYTIYSNLQPDIRRLICNHLQTAIDGKYLTGSEIQNALGEIASIKATENVRSEPTLAELHTAVGKYTDAYEEGDIEKLTSLFSYYIKTNSGSGVGNLQKDYTNLFANTSDRQMFIKNIDWSIKDRLAKGNGEIQILTIPKDEKEVVSMSGKIELVIEKINNKVLFTHIYNTEDKK